MAFPSSIPRKGRLVAVLTGYFDESGTQAGSPVVVVAGYVARQDQWETFGEQWERALRDWHIPFFHMTDYENRQKYFGDWTGRERYERLARLYDIISGNVQFSISTSILKSDYAAVRAPKEKAKIGGMYGLAAAGCLIYTAEEFRAIDDQGWVAYVFEAGAKGRHQVDRVFALNERNPVLKERYRLLSLRFEDKRQFAPLQAADILAYEIYKHLPREIGIDDHRWRQYPISRLIEVPRRWIYPTSELIRFALGLDD